MIANEDALYEDSDTRVCIYTPVCVYIDIYMT